jgi:hypothetical protein
MVQEQQVEQRVMFQKEKNFNIYIAILVKYY